MAKILYNIIGSISLSLGIVGAFLPLLPSTCFILLATWAFAKSSPRFHTWLYYNSPFSQSIQEWQLHRIIPTKVKLIAVSSIVVSYSITMLLVDNYYVLTTVGTSLLALITYLLSKPGELHSKQRSVTCQPIPVLHQQAI